MFYIHLQRGRNPNLDIPNVYHEIKWTVDNRLPNPCSDEPRWDEEYQVCMKGTLPRATVGWFQFNETDFTFKKFQKEEKSKKGSQYKAACLGDSGSGHWVTSVHDDTSSKSKTNDDDDTRRALVALYVGASSEEYKLNGMSVQAICGSNLMLKSGEKLIQGPVSEITTHEEVLTFIKKWL